MGGNGIIHTHEWQRCERAGHWMSKLLYEKHRGEPQVKIQTGTNLFTRIYCHTGHTGILRKREHSQLFFILSLILYKLPIPKIL